MIYTNERTDPGAQSRCKRHKATGAGRNVGIITR